MMQAREHRNAIAFQQIEVQGVRKTSQELPAKTSSASRKHLRIARQLFLRRGHRPQEFAAQSVGTLLVPVECRRYFGLCRRFENDLPDHRRTPSAFAICASVLD